MTNSITVRISDLNTSTVYYVTSVEDCRDGIDAMVYELVAELGEVITMGKVIGEPIN